MPFVYLLLFALILLQPSWPAPPPWLTGEGCSILAAALILISWLSAGLIAQATCWQMARHPEHRGPLLRRYARWRRNHFIALLAAFMALLYYLGWGAVLGAYWAEGVAWLFGTRNPDLMPGKQIALLAPFFVALFLAWERFYHIEKAAFEIVHEPDRYIPKRSFIVLQIRHQLLLVMPPLLLLLIQQLLFTAFPELDNEGYLPTLLVIAMMAAAFVAMPWLLRWFLGLKPLPAGPLRERLEATARRLRFGYANVLVWNTRRQFANALVTGFLPWIRYIVLTDRLIEDLTPDEIEAVFGHEVGHIKHHHLLFYLAFFLTSFIFLGLFWDTLKELLKQEPMMAYLRDVPGLGTDIDEVKDTLRAFSGFGKLSLLAAYTLLVFGYLSRRCERQADLYGAKTVSTDVFISALEKVAAINGIPRDRGGNWLLSWQHPTINQRIEFLQEMRDHPARAPRFHRGIFVMQWTFYLTLAFLLWQYPLGEIWRMLAEF